MFPRKLLAIACLLTTSLALAQQPPVKVNVLNVCAPSADDQKELAAALARIPAAVTFGSDFEVARGHSTLDPNTPIPGMQPMPDAPVSGADWVRVRREFPDSVPFTNAQYSFSIDKTNMVETLVLRMRDPKDLIQVSIEDSASAVTSPAAMLSTDTPVSRIKLERFGKSSVVLARCNGADGPAPNQSAYEPIFKSASTIMSRYRGVLGARRVIPQELVRLSAASARTDATKKKHP